jgi:hypothetical protein
MSAKMHKWGKYHHRGACGRVVPMNMMTDDFSEITCENCLRVLAAAERAAFEKHQSELRKNLEKHHNW